MEERKEPHFLRIELNLAQLTNDSFVYILSLFIYNKHMFSCTLSLKHALNAVSIQKTCTVPTGYRTVEAKRPMYKYISVQLF
jgi:hypothetical protein